MPKYLRSVTRKLSRPGSGLACGVRVPGIAGAESVAAGGCRLELWEVPGEDSWPGEAATPLSCSCRSEPMSLTRWVAVPGYGRRQWA